MNSRYLPAVVFVTCVLVGFGVGMEADGQSTSKPDWATPDWELPWGMSWPEPPVDVSATASADASLSGDTSSAEDASQALGPDADALEDPAAMTGSALAPGIFPGLVNSAPEASAEGATEATPEATPKATPESGSDEGATDTAADTAADTGALSAQLAQLQVLEEQLEVMSSASQAARQAMEAALSGVAPVIEEEVEPATPEQIASSLILLTDMVKKMKPAKAAELLQQWDDKLAIGILRRLGSRRATPILSKMPVTVSGRLTSQIAAGVGALSPVTAADDDVPPQGEVQ